jgi:hypothetical protein
MSAIIGNRFIERLEAAIHSSARVTAYPEITPKMEFCPDWPQVAFTRTRSNHSLWKVLRKALCAFPGARQDIPDEVLGGDAV